MTNVIRTAPARKYDPLAARKRLNEKYSLGNREATRVILAESKYEGLLREWAERTLASTADQIYTLNRRGEVLLPDETGVHRGQLELLFDRAITHGGSQCLPLFGIGDRIRRIAFRFLQHRDTGWHGDSQGGLPPGRRLQLGVDAIGKNTPKPAARLRTRL